MMELLFASALGAVSLTWLLSAALARRVKWRRAACWLIAATVVLLAGFVIGLGLSGSLSNEDCDDICDTPSWRGLLAGWTAAAAQLPIVVLAGLALLTRRNSP
jgi:hypothetical protein